MSKHHVWGFDEADGSDIKVATTFVSRTGGCEGYVLLQCWNGEELQAYVALSPTDAWNLAQSLIERSEVAR